MLPGPGVPEGDITGPKSRGLLFPERDIADPKCPMRLPTSWPRRFLRAQLERILALFRQRAKKDPRRETTGSDSRRALEAWCSRTGTLQAQIPRRLLTLLSSTPQTEWCYSGSPHPIFHRGPLRRNFFLWLKQQVIYIRQKKKKLEVSVRTCQAYTLVHIRFKARSRNRLQHRMPPKGNQINVQIRGENVKIKPITREKL